MRHGTRKESDVCQRVAPGLAKGRATSDGTTMSDETREWLFEVVLVVLTVIALVRARGHSIEPVEPRQDRESSAEHAESTNR
jgi:hypothetical protein